MKKDKPIQNNQLSKRRKLIFTAISILLPFIFLVIIELTLRISGYGDNHSLFIQHPDKEFNEYMVVNPEIGKKYFQKLEYSSPAKDIFLKHKPDDVFRIFVMGSSDVAGFPYENNLMFSRILNEQLRDAYPNKKIEMVNTALTAINSFTLADFMPQILEQQPDAILLYAGHNEFYGAFGVGSNEAFFHSPALIRMHLKLMNYRIYQLVVDLVGRSTGIFKSGEQALKKRGTLMTRMVKDADIIYGSKQYKEGLNNFEQNFNSMLSKAKQKNVMVFISDLVSNLRDTKPFKSIQANGLKGADEYYEAAKVYEKQGESEKARENYTLARDYDCIRFRASSDINQIIRKLAGKYDCKFVPTLALFNSNSPSGIVGDNLLTEHVHPNIPGEFLLSEAFYREIVKSKKIDSTVDEQNVKSTGQFIKDYGYSELDVLIGKHRIANLKYHWPFRDETKEYIDYREIYKPVGLIDSLAFNVMAKRTMTLTEAHEIMAEKYKNLGDWANAFREYNCLTQINPFRGKYFRNAGDCLLKLNDLAGALHFFERSTENGQGVFYAHFRAGEICLIKNDLESALKHFQESQQTADAQEKKKALMKIYQTLCYLNRKNEGKAIEAYFHGLNPSEPLLVPERAGSYMDYVPLQVKSFVDEAKKASERKDFDKAIDLLQTALNVKESTVVFRMMGEVYLKKGDYEKAEEFLMKAYPDFKFDTKFLHHLFIGCMTVKKPDVAKMVLAQLTLIDPKYPSLGILRAMAKSF